MRSCDRVFLHGKVHADYRKALNVLFTKKALRYVANDRCCSRVALIRFRLAVSTSPFKSESTESTSSHG